MRYRIGEFARLAGTSIKTLRFYDASGLLEPAEIDARSGYRYYAPEQLRDLGAIRALKDLGATLDDIRRVVARGAPREDRRRLLLTLRDRAALRLRETSRSLRWIDAALENAAPDANPVSIAMKRRDEIRIASIRTQLRDYAGIGEVERDLTRAVQRRFRGETHGVLWHRCEASGAIDGEPFVELAGRAPRSRAYDVRVLPSSVVASAFCESDDVAAVRTYDAIDRWLHAHDYRLAGAKREIYVGSLLEIQFPVEAL